MKAQLVELRIRAAGRPGFRMEVGTAKSKAQLDALYRRRNLLRRLHSRGEHDVLDAVKAGTVTVEQLERLTDQWGIADYRKHLDLAPPAPAFHVPSLDEHVDRWLGALLKDGTRGVYRKALTHLRDFEHDGERLGGRPWHLAAPRHVIGDVKVSLRSRLASNTIRTTMGAWSGFFEWAIEREQSEASAAGRKPLLEVNPVRAAKVWDPIELTRHRFLTWDEFWRLVAVAPAPMRAQYATLGLGGLRVGELMALPPAHVHLPTRIHVGPWGGWVPKGYPRSKHGVRDVPMHHALVPYLEEYARTYAGEETFFVNPDTGFAWQESAFRRRMRKDVEAAGMTSGAWSRADEKLTRKADGITPHTLRHTLASWMAQDDIQLMKIAAILGDTEETVRQHYAHLLPSDLDRSINRVGANR